MRHLREYLAHARMTPSQYEAAREALSRTKDPERAYAPLFGRVVCTRTRRGFLKGVGPAATAAAVGARTPFDWKFPSGADPLGGRGRPARCPSKARTARPSSGASGSFDVEIHSTCSMMT